MSTPRESQAVPFVMMGVVVVWGSAFSVIRILLAELPPVALASARTVAAALTFTIIWLLRPHVPADRRPGDALRIVVAGLAGIALYNVALAWGSQFVRPGVVSVVVSTAPLLVAAMGALILGERVDLTRGAGMVIALVGVCVLVVTAGQGFTIRRLQGVLFVLGAALAWAVYTIAVKPLTGRYDALRLNLYGAWASAIAVAPFLTADVSAFGSLSVVNWAWLFYLGGINGGLAVLFYAWSLYRWSAAGLSSFLYLVPVSSFAWAMLLLGDVPEPGTLLGASIVAVGLILVWRSRPVTWPKTLISKAFRVRQLSLGRS